MQPAGTPDLPIPPASHKTRSIYNNVSFALGAVTALIGLLGIIGLYLNISVLVRISSGYISIAFSTALILIVFGSFLAVHAIFPLKGRVRTGAAIFLAIIVIFCLIVFLQDILGGSFLIEDWIVGYADTLFTGPTSHISPVTVGLFIPSGIALILLMYSIEPAQPGNQPQILNIIGILGSGIAILSFTFVLSYFYGSPFLYETSIVPIAFTTSGAISLFGIGLVTSAGPSSVPLRYFTGPTTRARLLRTFLPLTIVILTGSALVQIVLGPLYQVHNAIVDALILLFFLVITGFVVTLVSDGVSRAIDRAELKRKTAEDELRAAYGQLIAQEKELRHQYEKLAENERTLRESEAEHRTILRTAMDGFSLIDRAGAFLEVNDAFCTMLGYTREEMLNLNLRSIEEMETPEVIALHMNEILKKGEDRFETRYHQKSGNIIDVEVSVVFSEEHGGCFISFHRDITARNRDEKALGQATKKLKLLNYITFNDIQNAVFTIRGILDLEKDSIADQQQKKFIDMETGAVQKITHSLNFAQSYQDLGVRSPRWQNLNLVFHLAISHLDFSRIDHAVSLDNLEIFADPLLEKVFSALAENVIRHGGNVTQVSLSYLEKPKSLVLVFEDNGTGIPDPVKEAIFERGFGPTKGMSLFLSREILEITGITIKETGTVGKGARFEMEVPIGAYRFMTP